jgi:hypothetical protein
MEDMFDQLARRVRTQFPSFYVTVEEVPESPRTRAIAVYGVPLSAVKTVRSFINDLDWELSQQSDCAVLARVVNRETTAAYYPEHLPLVADYLFTLLQSFQQPMLAEDIWSRPQLPPRHTPAVQYPANHELALAA